MAWPKIKNIIILILLATNLCLTGFTINRQTQAAQLEKQPRAEAIAFLQERNIWIQEDIVPDAVVLKSMQVTRDKEREAVLAQSLLGENVSVESRGAEVYRYFNENGFIQFHSNGEFSARFYGNGYLARGSIEVHSHQMLERIEFFGELVRKQTDGMKTVLTYQEFWEDASLFNCQVQVNYEAGMMVSMTGGRRLAGIPEESAQQEQITPATALMRFYNGVKTLGDTCTQVKEIIQGYIITSTITESTPMTPVWQIVTDTCTYQLDMLTGQLSRVQ